MTILIVLIAGIGDLILASKSIRALRNRFPDATIHIITNSDAVPLARYYPYLDQVWEFPIREMRKRKMVIFEMFNTVLQLRKYKYDLVINLHSIASARGALRMGFLFSLLRSPLKIGHDYKGFGVFVNKKVPADNFRGKHLVDAFSDVVKYAGGEFDNNGIDVYYDRMSEEKWQHLFNKRSGNNKVPVIAVNPGGDRPSKHWPTEYFAAVSDLLIDHYNAHIIILGSPGEKAISQQIQEAMKEKAINLAGKMTLSDLVYIISRLDLMITNDSSPMHIAAAYDIKQVAIFGPGFPETFHPYTSQDNYILLHKNVDCSPCAEHACGQVSCLTAISVKEVFKAARALLPLEFS